MDLWDLKVVGERIDFDDLEALVYPCSIVWPMERTKMRHYPGRFYFTPKTDILQPVLIGIMDFQRIACSVKIVSWARVRQQ